jgi:hypothetical protein
MHRVRRKTSVVGQRLTATEMLEYLRRYGITDISHHLKEKLKEPSVPVDDACYCFAAPLDTCPIHGKETQCQEGSGNESGKE